MKLYITLKNPHPAQVRKAVEVLWCSAEHQLPPKKHFSWRSAIDQGRCQVVLGTQMPTTLLDIVGTQVIHMRYGSVVADEATKVTQVQVEDSNA